MSKGQKKDDELSEKRLLESYSQTRICLGMSHPAPGSVRQILSNTRIEENIIQTLLYYRFSQLITAICNLQLTILDEREPFS